MKIMITGATGFIGSHVLAYLSSLDGYEVSVLSRNDFEMRNLGVLPDVVVHCAWTREKDLHSVEHLRFSQKSCEMFEYCRQNGVRVINIGSSSEYGVKNGAMREDMLCLPITTYGIAKLATTLYAKKEGFNTLRLFTVVGEGGKSFFDTYEKSMKWSYPSDCRDIVSVSTVCKAIERLLHASHLFGEIINVGSGKCVRYGDIAGVRDKRWMKYPQRQYEPRAWFADTHKMKKLLNLCV